MSNALSRICFVARPFCVALDSSAFAAIDVGFGFVPFSIPFLVGGDGVDAET